MLELFRGNIKLGTNKRFKNYRDQLNEIEHIVQPTPAQKSYIGNPKLKKATTMLEQSYGKEHAEYLLNMVFDAKRSGRHIVIANLPLRVELINLTLNNKQNFGQVLLRHLAIELAIDYFDGHSVFKEKSAEEILNQYWLPYDGHWSTEGAAFFANSFVAYLVERLNTN